MMVSTAVSSFWQISAENLAINLKSWQNLTCIKSQLLWAHHSNFKPICRLGSFYRKCFSKFKNMRTFLCEVRYSIFTLFPHSQKMKFLWFIKTTVQFDSKNCSSSGACKARIVSSTRTNYFLTERGKGEYYGEHVANSLTKQYFCNRSVFRSQLYL